MKSLFVTLFDHRYLSRGLALYESLQRHSPGARLVVLTLSDECRRELTNRRLPSISILSLADLEGALPELLVAKSNRSLKEYYYTLSSALCYYYVAIKPSALLVTYLDADTYFFAAPDAVFNELEGWSVGITGHNFPRWLRKREQYGRFNVGWVTFRCDSYGRECVEWWFRKCIEWCYERVEPNRYADQKYLDEWPERFRRVRVIENPGVNCAPWNLAGVNVAIASGRVLINRRPLILFHFADLQQVSSRRFNTQLGACWVRCAGTVKNSIYLPYITHVTAVAEPRLDDGLGPRVLSGTRLGVNLKTRLRNVLGVLLGQYVTVQDPDRHVAFVVADNGQHSGQFIATHIIYKHLDNRLWSRTIVSMPALERSRGALFASTSYLLGLGRSIGLILQCAFRRRVVLHLNVGQTRAALVRDSIPLFTLIALGCDVRAVVSLHGSIFLAWHKEATEAKWLRRIMHRAVLMTLLSERQRTKMAELGLPESKLVVVPNCCEEEGVDHPTIVNKQEASGPIRVLYLSSLIAAKGYPALLSALKLMANQPGPAVEAVICGRITHSRFDVAEATLCQSSEWIEAQISEVNRSGRVKVRWVRGANGPAKWDLFRTAQVFVFPSSYYVEAQPIVLLEAMAFGCAIVTSTVGEIPELLPDGTAIRLADVSPGTIADTLERLVCSSEMRTSLAAAALARFSSSYTRKRYIDQWDKIFRELWDRPSR